MQAKDIVDVEKDIGIAGVRYYAPRKLTQRKSQRGKKNTGKDKPAKDKAPKFRQQSDVEEVGSLLLQRFKKVVRKLATAPAEGGAALDEKKEAADVPDKDEEVLEKAGIKNCVPSAGIYDPLSPVDPAKLQKLKEMMAPFKHLPLGRATDTVDFYRILITERKDWPDRQYGWLYDDFKIKPERIKFKAPLTRGWYNGLEPKDQQTNMKWIEDVDHLYIVHQIGGNHWLALDVDLVKGHSDCYDSIVGHHTKESELSVLEACRPFTRMIPKMMNEIIPPEIYPPRFEQFSFRRRNKSRVPQNSQVGDCGVYALKFIECLALGVSFVGICDENIQAIRVKMATEIYDEAPDLLAAFDVQ
ncbi:Ulp1 protease family C-terminal catalytic domain [Arabidopsis thaliana x Arabidopsis arenosa]|uniref:Ulp1 protease family C-terminal catalytic domain n=1 Tax=Arabidopsis thaliana x Arabidopsis arenosa TaxID=1240361 RepID=A0A8T1XEM4_9BRAS|nr:Ulp1 protease family C-terminal catalytic domain [Arabidopsis thaliana x Arabidopsis arenosa]